jgi:hypothetical protein
MDAVDQGGVKQLRIAFAFAIAIAIAIAVAVDAHWVGHAQAAHVGGALARWGSEVGGGTEGGGGSSEEEEEVVRMGEHESKREEGVCQNKSVRDRILKAKEVQTRKQNRQ